MGPLVRIANWPLAWKVPLLAAGLTIGVAVLISSSYWVVWRRIRKAISVC